MRRLALPLLLALAACGETPADYGRAEPAMEPAAEAVVTVEPMMEAAVHEAPDPAPRGTNPGNPRRGVVTAGDIDDALNLAAFRRYLARGTEGLPQLGFGAPVLVDVAGPIGKPAPGLRYTLRKPGAAEPFHQGYTGPGGRIVAFPQVLGAGSLAQVEVRLFDEAGQEVARRTLPTGKPALIGLSSDAEWQPDFLDLVLVVDTTGSMGDEIAWLQRELTGAVRNAARSAPGLSVRYGLIAYRDRGDDYVVQSFGFTPDTARMNGWLRSLRASGGGDTPEAAADALAAAAALPWRSGKGERLLIHVADAPPHMAEAPAFLSAVRRAATQGVQVFPVAASGTDPAAEYLMRQAAAATGGRYLFLTDDSGVGLAHAEPTIPCYRVTPLAALLSRLLATELTGIRREAPQAEVIRTVGSYADGVCRN
jgi:hypothetical protein